MEHCRAVHGLKGTGQQHIRVIRRQLEVDQRMLSAHGYGGQTQADASEEYGSDLVKALQTAPLPCLFIDDYLPVDLVADRLRMPFVSLSSHVVLFLSVIMLSNLSIPSVSILVSIIHSNRWNGIYSTLLSCELKLRKLPMPQCLALIRPLLLLLGLTDLKCTGVAE